MKGEPRNEEIKMELVQEEYPTEFWSARELRGLDTLYNPLPRQILERAGQI